MMMKKITHGLSNGRISQNKETCKYRQGLSDNIYLNSGTNSNPPKTYQTMGLLRSYISSALKSSNDTFRSGQEGSVRLLTD